MPWSHITGTGTQQPGHHSVNGKQYVAVPAGWGGQVEGFAPKTYGAPQGTALHVFSLP